MLYNRVSSINLRNVNNLKYLHIMNLAKTSLNATMRTSIFRLSYQHTQTQQQSSIHYSAVRSRVAIEKDFLYKSIIPTDHFQKSLPHLPIPKLEDTCSRYLDAQKPLLSQDEFSKTSAIVNEFMNTTGKELNDQLVAEDKKNKHTSYVNDPWFDMYLKDRRAIALNHNPFMVLCDDPKPEYNDQLLRSTNIVMTALRFMKTLRANVLEPEIFHLNSEKSDTNTFKQFVRLLPKSISWYGAYWYKAFPLDMVQYDKLFNSTRIPRPVKDELYTDMNATHLCVLRNGHFYTVNCMDHNGDIRPATEVMACLQSILQNPRPTAEHPIAVLSAQDRDTWSTVREKLIQAGNTEQLKAIDSAYFVLNLDTEEFDLNNPKQLNEAAHSFLHGDGTNRWFDKSFELAVQKNGVSSLNFEHAWGDGVAVLRFMIELHKEITNTPIVKAGTKPVEMNCSTEVTNIDFNLTGEIKNDIATALQSFRQKTGTLSMDVMRYVKFGKNDIKKLKLSPDSFMQLAIQMGYYRLSNGGTAATYESSSTAAYKHGRTETVRSCTNETKRACELFAQSTNTLPSIDELANALKACSTKHGELTKNAAMGQGFDRHLFALKYLCQNSSDKMPALFTDPAYAKLNHIILSTSTLTHPSVKYGAFGPVVPDGFGIGYGVQDNEVGAYISGYPGQNPSEMADAISSSLDDLYCILNGKDFRN